MHNRVKPRNDAYKKTVVSVTQIYFSCLAHKQKETIFL